MMTEGNSTAYLPLPEFAQYPCSLFREYLERKRGHRQRSREELSAAKEASMSTDAEWDPNAR